MQIEASSRKKKGELIDEAKQEKLHKKIKEGYDKQTSPIYVASRLWTDAIIDPITTRQWISRGIEAANHAPIEETFSMGVLQV